MTIPPARASLEARSTRLRYALIDLFGVQLDGHPLRGTGTLHLTEPATLTIPGIGTLTIEPGGDDLSGCRTELDGLETRLQGALAGVGVSTLAEAEAAWMRRNTLERERAQHELELGRLAPEGVPGLEAQRLEAEADLTRMADSLGLSDAQCADATNAIEDADLAAQERAVGVATAHARACTAALARAQGQARQAKEAWIRVRAEHQQAETRAARTRAELAVAREQLADQVLADALGEAREALRQREAEVSALEVSTAEADPEAAAHRLADCEHQLRRLAVEGTAMQTRISGLRIALEEAGRHGQMSAEAEARRALADVDAQLTDLRARGRALALLKRTFDSELEQAKTRIVEPLIEALRPYLERVLGDALPRVNAALGLAGITRDGVEEDFAGLSIGTREQLAVLLRLAYADVCIAQGRPVCVVLDDALVHSDSPRRTRMKAVLREASARYQILFLTCHGESYRDMADTFVTFDQVS